MTLPQTPAGPGLTTPVPTLSQFWFFLETYGVIGLAILGFVLLVYLIKFLRFAWPTIKRTITVVDTMLTAPEKLDALSEQASNLSSGFVATGAKLDDLTSELREVKQTVADVKKQVLPNGGSSMRDDQAKLGRNVYKLGVALENYTGHKLELEDTHPRAPRPHRS